MSGAKPHPVVHGKRFEPFYLWELLDYWSFMVQDYVKGLSVQDVARKVIVDVKYPFYFGMPDDKHDVNYFHGKYCKSITLDYWQRSSETALVKYGDCEDSSILFVACCLALGVDSKRVYEVFGEVRDAQTDRFIGGHGWAVICDHLGEGWRLYESTLDHEPQEYPKIEDPRKPAIIGKIKYVPWVIWNDKEYEEVGHGLSSYLKLKFKDKERREKYELIAESLDVTAKPITTQSRFKRLRWR